MAGSVGKTGLCLAAVLLVTAWLSVPVYAEEDEFPEGMTEQEKQQLLDEMQEDIDRDAPYTIGSNPAGSIYDGIEDEDARNLIREMLPSDEILDRFVEDSDHRVMPLAGFQTGFDRGSGLYRYILPTGSALCLSTPMGSWADHAVALMPEGGMSIFAVTRDGEDVTASCDEEGKYFFRETGQYAFIAHGDQAEQRSYISGTFRIVSTQIPVTESFLWAPESYEVASVLVDHRPVEVKDGKYLELIQDGLYEVSFRPKSRITGLPEDYSVTFVRDTTPPSIKWDGEIHNGMFTGEVAFDVSEKDAQVEILYNGQPAVSPTHVLAAAGHYYITVSDATGNMRFYSFVIERRGEIPWKLVGICAAVLLLVAVALVFTAGQRIRVR